MIISDSFHSNLIRFHSNFESSTGDLITQSAVNSDDNLDVATTQTPTRFPLKRLTQPNVTPNFEVNGDTLNNRTTPPTLSHCSSLVNLLGKSISVLLPTG